MKNRRQAETQNMIIAMALSLLVLVYWNYYIEAPRQKAEIAAQHAKAQTDKQTVQEQKKQEAPFIAKPRAELVAGTPRVTIASANLKGSIALKGLRFDDLTLPHYRETLAADSPAVTLFSPADDENAYFTEFGWSGDSASDLPTSDTLWSTDNKTLTPQQPVTLSWKNAHNDTFTVRIALDDRYLFTITQNATGSDGKPLHLQPYAYINRVQDIKKHPPISIIQEGPLGVIDGTLKEAPYKTLLSLMKEKEKDKQDQSYSGASGWVGMTDKYWLAAIIPQDGNFTSHFTAYSSRERDHFQTYYLGDARGENIFRFFAGAKELPLLEAYGAEYHIPLFERAVDFGFFYWLAEPIFHLLSWFYALVGNFGIAILLLTVLVKLLMYPLASTSFISMNKMKLLQPKMKELQERHKNDKTQLHQAMAELYKREKVNPASGCLPIVVQIPVFFSLYKVLYVTIEMRHAPFFGWIHDLSAPDPTNIFTLFGLLPWTLPAVLHLGIWPMLMCLTMFIQQSQSPPPADPAQAKMMKFLPLVLLFLFSNVAAGLVIYWTWSNTLSILQQWHIKRRHGEKKAV